MTRCRRGDANEMRRRTSPDIASLRRSRDAGVLHMSLLWGGPHSYHPGFGIVGGWIESVWLADAGVGMMAALLLFLVRRCST